MKNKYQWLFLIMTGCLALSGCQKGNDVESREAEVEKNWSKQEKVINGERFLIADLNGVVLRVPEEYVGQNPPNSPSFDVRTYWPEMVPVTHATHKKYDSYSMIEILFRLDSNSYKEKVALLDRSIRQGWVEEPVQSERFSGLLEYRKSKTGEPWLFKANDNSVHLPSGEPLVISCSVDSKMYQGKYWFCESIVSINNGVFIIYRFSSNHLKSWRPLYEAIMGLIKSFSGE